MVNYSTELDISNPGYAAEITNVLGGEAYLSASYPQLYRLLQNARQAGRCAADLRRGFHNSAYVLNVVYDKQRQCAYTVGKTYLTQRAARLYCWMVIYRNGEQIASSYGFFHNADRARLECRSDPFPEPTERTLYKAILSVLWQPVGEDRLHLMRTSELYASVEGSGDEFVKSLTVDDPAYKKSTSGPIRVALWRSDEDNMDYEYPYVPIYEGNYEMHLKLGGSAVLDGNHSIDRFSSLSAMLNQQGSGSVFYCHKPGVSEITVSSDRKTLNWDLSDNWECFVPECAARSSRVYSFDMKVQFVCRDCQAEHQLILSSDEEPGYRGFKFYKKVPAVLVLWGCLAEGTQITMADGTMKNIEEIQVGALLRRPDGGSTSVQKVITGTESTMYQICLEDGKSVLATITHPFLSDGGMLLVQDFTLHTRLETDGGFCSPVRFCYPVAYGKTVYSLETEQGASFLANGIVSGTLADQGRLSQRQEPVVSDEQILREIEQLSKDAAEGRIFGGVLL